MMNRLYTVLGYPLRRRAHLLAAGVLALVLAACTPAVAQAETLSFTNDTNVALVIQGACIVNGAVRRDQPMLVQPGAVARITLPGNKLITFYDAKVPNRILYQNTLQASPQDTSYSVQADGNKVKITPKAGGMAGPTGPPF
jgi:hypothetical protein